MTKPVLGYIQPVILPDLGIQCYAKVDTGACTSSLHATNIRPFTRDGQPWLSFSVHFFSAKQKIEQDCEAKLIAQRSITSSNGASSLRYIIETPLQVANQCFLIEVSLSNRRNMNYPMLLGRKAISGRFLVDVER